jgi:hypothetical protein
MVTRLALAQAPDTSVPAMQEEQQQPRCSSGGKQAFGREDDTLQLVCILWGINRYKLDGLDMDDIVWRIS